MFLIIILMNGIRNDEIDIIIGKMALLVLGLRDFIYLLKFYSTHTHGIQ